VNWININLDSIDIYARNDPQDMLGRIKELPAQCRRAWQAVGEFTLPADYADVDNIVVLGMGGSAIGGDLVRTLALNESKVPVIIHRDYGLPAYVDERTLMIASSYSGNTEEVLSAFVAALKTGAQKLAITTGGRLGELAAAGNIPVFKIDYQSQPRAALGYSFIPTIGVLQKLGFLTEKTAGVEEAISVMERMVTELDEKSPLSVNVAKQIAQRLHGKLVVIYGAGILAEVAHRWKTQINENSKAWAFYEVFPELNHNATVGYPFPPEIIEKIKVIVLRSPLFNERIELRYKVTEELLERAGVPYEYVDSTGESALSQMMGLIITGDFVSYYLGILNGVDPTPVEVISYLKDKLAKG
jgi:glucose/mannose-6-phosphate isomerase